jgi:hypothetical protein
MHSGGRRQGPAASRHPAPPRLIQLRHCILPAGGWRLLLLAWLLLLLVLLLVWWPKCCPGGSWARGWGGQGSVAAVLRLQQRGQHQLCTVGRWLAA